MIAHRNLGRRNPFLPTPAEPYPTHGVHTHPGFHTTRNRDVAAAYACAKVLARHTTEPDADEGVPASVDDYPVVVELDMRGLTPLVDYDAEHFLDGLYEVVRHTARDAGLRPEGLSENILRDLAREIAEGDYESTDLCGDGMNWIGLAFAPDSYTRQALEAWLDVDEVLAVEAVRAILEKRRLPERALMLAVDQYRYQEEVGEERVLEVLAVHPVADEVFDDDGSEEMETIGERWPGFTIGEASDFEPRFDYLRIWQRPHEVAHVEHHGTTWARLSLACPGVVANISARPPSPPLDLEAHAAWAARLRRGG